MDIFELLLDRRGRIGRLKYFVTSMITHIVCGFLANIFAHLATFETIRISFFFMLGIMIVDIGIQANLLVKRLHDFNVSGWWALYMYSFMVTTTVIGNGFEYVGHVVALVFYLVLLLMPGTKGTNSFETPEIQT